MSSKNIGIKDVATAAGVSVTTVSHVLNEVPHARVSPETRNKVRSAAEQLGYGPNRLAQALRRQRTGILGVAIEDVATTPHAGRIILGADDAAKARGYNLMVVTTSSPAGLESLEADFKALMDRRVDGILYTAARQRTVELPGIAAGVPCVLVGGVAEAANVPAVIPDEAVGARAAIQALLEAGHTRIGFINTTDDAPSARRRLQGFRAAMAEAGLDGGAAPMESGLSGAQGGYEAALRILAPEDRADIPTALFCYNDLMAMGAYRAAAELGLAIPGDLSVVGFGDQELIATSLRPSLTTVAPPYYEMGARAAGQLIDAVEGTAGPAATAQAPTLLDCTLVRRDSVAVPRQ
jgi:LacI family transcriptional regulator